MYPAKLTLSIDWTHIREAERRGRLVSPVTLALVEQSRFCRGEFTLGQMNLIDTLSGEAIHYEDNESLREYVRAWVAGAPLSPAQFVLARADASG